MYTSLDGVVYDNGTRLVPNGSKLLASEFPAASVPPLLSFSRDASSQPSAWVAGDTVTATMTRLAARTVYFFAVATVTTAGVSEPTSAAAIVETG